MSISPCICALDPDTKKQIKMYLFKNVQNVEVIRNNIIQGTWNCGIIKPSLILDPFQVVVAANKAAVAALSGSMVTRTVYAEILYNLSLTKNITQSLSKFGIERGGDLLVCFLTHSEELPEEKDILSQITGEPVPLGHLHKFTDVKELKTVYKLNKVDVKSNDHLLDLIVSRIVTKNFVSN